MKRYMPNVPDAGAQNPTRFFNEVNKNLLLIAAEGVRAAQETTNRLNIGLGTLMKNEAAPAPVRSLGR